MLKLRQIGIALSTCALQACVAPPTTQELTIQPLLRVRNSAQQTAMTYYQLGKYHQERGNLELALAAYTHSIALDNRQLEPRNAAAAILARQGNLDEAKAMLLKLVADYPSVAHPYNNLGYVYYLQGDFDLAASTLQQALVLDSADGRARNNLKLAEAAMASQRELAKMEHAAEPAVTQASTPAVTEQASTPLTAVVLAPPAPAMVGTVSTAPTVPTLPAQSTPVSGSCRIAC